MTFTDTHCHIHEAAYADKEGALVRAREKGIERLVCVGTDETTSAEAVAFAAGHDNVWASLGLHPHDAKHGTTGVLALAGLLDTSKNPHVGKIVAIGECGLDYFYDNSPREMQLSMLEEQLQLAQDHSLPVIFHVREAFDDFWPVYDNFSSLRGVLHSYTDTAANLEMALTRDLYIGVNGISTFTKDPKQHAMFGSIPLENLLLETDAPFLTPVPHRGMVNEPAFITHVAHHIANLRSINLKELSRATERNATTLFFSN